MTMSIFTLPLYLDRKAIVCLQAVFLIFPPCSNKEYSEDPFTQLNFINQKGLCRYSSLETSASAKIFFKERNPAYVCVFQARYL